MIQYIIDGSQKGLMVGAGIVEINSYGFFKPYSFSNYHIAASGLLSEIFAVECSIKIIQKYDEKITTSIRMFTDNDMVVKLFNKDIENGKLSSDAYIASIQAQIHILNKLCDFSIRRAQSEHEHLCKIAHKLSREYLSDAHNKIFLPDVKVGLVAAEKEKIEIKKKINLDIKRVNNTWALLANGNVVEENTKFLKLIENFISKYKTNHEKTTVIDLSDNIKKMLKAVKGNEKVNSILDTINKVS